MAEIEIRGLSVEYRAPGSGSFFKAVDNVDLSIETGEFVTIVGASGCGKSTLLSAIAGLTAYKGSIVVNGVEVTGPGADRSVVFQDASLLPWRTVSENVKFALQLRRAPQALIDSNARKFISMVGLTPFADYYPSQLSGGMRQRTNIARALSANPQVLLMDEPFGALDAQTREVMAEDLLKIWESERKTAVFVTHDVTEAILLADRVVVMGRNPGHVKEIITIDLPRPRLADLEDDELFIDYKRRIKAHLAADRLEQI